MSSISMSLSGCTFLVGSLRILSRVGFGRLEVNKVLVGIRDSEKRTLVTHDLALSLSMTINLMILKCFDLRFKLLVMASKYYSIEKLLADIVCKDWDSNKLVERLYTIIRHQIVFRHVVQTVLLRFF